MSSESPVKSTDSNQQHAELLPTNTQDEGEFRFHYTVGSGSSRKAIRTASHAATNPGSLDTSEIDALVDASLLPDEIPDPEWAMISYARRDNRPFEGPNWFIDSGGYSVQKKFHEYPTGINDYVAYLLKHDDQIEKYALRDWACAPSLLRDADRTVRTHQEWSIRDHVYCLEAAEDAGLSSEPVAVLQGHNLEEYLWCFDYLDEHGLATPTLGIGSISRPNKTSEVRSIIQGLRDAIPSKHDFHGFGLTKTVLSDPDTLRALASADSTAWHSKAVHSNHTNPERATTVPMWVRTVEAFADYHADLAALATNASESNSQVQVMTLGEWSAGQSKRSRVDYPLIECICGNLVDPNRGPFEENTAQCRFCEQAQLNIWNQQLSTEC